MNPSRIFVPAAVLAATVAFAAEPMNIRQGRWSVTSTMVLGGAPLYVDGMPEAGRAEYAKSWAKQVGKPTTDTDDDECITAKDIREMDFFKDMKEGNAKSCKQTITKQSATAMAGTLECKDAKTTTRTELDYVASSPTSFKGSFKSTMTSPNGTTTMTITMAGKWLAASCPAEDDEDDAEE
jgi:hypothetical protein